MCVLLTFLHMLTSYEVHVTRTVTPVDVRVSKTRVLKLPITCVLPDESFAVYLFDSFLQEGDTEISAKMQNLALAEGALPRHLHTAMYTQSSDNRLLTNRSDHYDGKGTVCQPIRPALTFYSGFCIIK